MFRTYFYVLIVMLLGQAWSCELPDNEHYHFRLTADPIEQVDHQQFCLSLEDHLEKKFTRLGLDIFSLTSDPALGVVSLKVPVVQRGYTLQPDDYQELLLATSALEFRMVWNRSDEEVWITADSLFANFELYQYRASVELHRYGIWLSVPLGEVERLEVLLDSLEQTLPLPPGSEFAWSQNPRSFGSDYLEKEVFLLRPVRPDWAISSAMITFAEEAIDPNTTEVYVYLDLDEEGTRRFAALTAWAAEDQRVIAIVNDGQVLSSPRVMDKVTNGSVSLSGNFTRMEALLLAARLSGQPFPYRVQVEEVLK